jgi:hypothetical protein
MRKQLTALLGLAVGALISLSQASVAQAADLAVTRHAHVFHRGGRIVRDYDGTPVVWGRYRPTHPVVVSEYIGAPIVVDNFYRSYPVQQQPLPYIRRHAYYLGLRAPYVVSGWAWQPYLDWYY